MSEGQHLPTLRHSQWEGGQIDRIPDEIVRCEAFAHPTPPVRAGKMPTLL
ncbi:hypothetical protein [Moorena producens]|nr:hypothetical protein [Moorena producens]